MPLSLAGRRVAVTRGKGTEDALSTRLAELGAEVLDAPAITFGPPASHDPLDAALHDLAGVAWIAFASAHAVECTVARAAAIGVDRADLRRPRLAAVGGATAQRVSALLREPDLVPGDARGEALARALASEVRGRRVLVPSAEEGRPELVEGLLAAGAEVHAPVAYRTVPAAPESLAPLVAALERGTVDAVAFASPSAVRSVISTLAGRVALLERTVLAALGPTTAAELRGAGLVVAVQPARASGAALADAIAEHLGSGG